MTASNRKLSAFVVSFNRAPIVGTCLRGLRFADELIVVDKSSGDETPAIAASLADRVITVPWSPTVEETRAFAAAQCTHDWVLFLDDDECLSPEAAAFIRQELAEPQADAYAFPLRHYILGIHDEQAYYWPEHHVRLFRRGALRFGGTVHAGTELLTDRVQRILPETGVCIHHLSHRDVAQWVEKANRYTSRADRMRVMDAGQDVAAFAQARIAHWLSRTRDQAPGGYPATVAVLRTLYDLIDRLKVWEEEQGLDGSAHFRAVCDQLDAAYGAVPGPGQATLESAAPVMPQAPDATELLRRSLLQQRAAHEAIVARLSQSVEDAEHRAGAADRRAAAADDARQEAERARERAERARAEAERTREVAERTRETAERTQAVAEWARAEAERAREAAEQRAKAAIQLRQDIERSTCWRATAWPRRMVGRLRRRR